MGSFRFLVGACALGLLAFGCGDDDGPAEGDAGTDASSARDASRRDAPMAAECGDGIVEGDEVCDDGNTDETDECLSDCTLACGDGVVAGDEICDTGIADGEDGACPSSCDDGMACTSDTLAGAMCAAECVNAPISACTNGDGCCPAGCTSTSDDDCDSVCGNGMIEGSETCEEGVGAGCPTACDDGAACTVDTLEGDAAMCTAMCTTTDITTCTDGDGCCAPGCTSGDDDDCSASCGNGVVEAGETCEAGVGAGCPTMCDDGNVCTADRLDGSAANCNAACSATPIVACTSGDGCCAPGCNMTNDDDCAPVCGNMVVEMGETCDDGNADPTDGCDACMSTSMPTAFRIDDLDLRDPHAFADVFFVCRDITNTVLGQPGVNPQFQDAIRNDENSDGFLDLSFVFTFDPLRQGNGDTGPITLYEADCTAPRASTACTPTTGGTSATTTYTVQQTGTCLSPIAGTTRPSYTPDLILPSGPCFSTAPTTFMLDIDGIVVTLNEARVGATFVGNPATRLENGLLMGFLTEADAEMAMLPSDIAIVGGQSLASVLRGGRGNCASGSDQDTHPTLGNGWWLYLNFDGPTVPWTP